MVLANRTRVQNSRTLLRAFGGLNEGYGCSEAEYRGGIPFSSPGFPGVPQYSAGINFSSRISRPGPPPAGSCGPSPA